MANKVKPIGFKATPDEYESIQQASAASGFNVSDFLRKAVEQMLSNGEPQDNRRITWLEEQITHLQTELSESRKRSDMLIAQLTQQVDRASLQLEDMHQRKPFWARVFRR